MALALALVVKLKLLYFEFCDIVQARHVKIASMFVTIFHVRSFENVLKTCYFKKKMKKKNKNSQLLNSAFRTITRRSTRSKYFLLTDNHRRTRTDHINNRELNKGVCKEFSSLFYIPENIINNYFIIFRSLLLSRKIFRRPIR